MERGEEQGSQNYKRGAFLSLSFYSLSSSLSLFVLSLSLFDFCALREKTRSKSLSCQKKETQKLASAALFIAAAATAAAPSGRRRGPLLLLRRALPQRPAHLGVLPSHQLEDGVPHRVASRAKRRRRRRRRRQQKQQRSERGHGRPGARIKGRRRQGRRRRADCGERPCGT